MLGFLPWEKWLPPYVFGPLICVASACVLGLERDLHWWNIVLLGFGIVYGAWGTWVWILLGGTFSGSQRQTIGGRPSHGSLFPCATAFASLYPLR